MDPRGGYFYVKRQLQSMTAICHTFKIKTSKKCDNLGIFTQKVPFLDYNKTKERNKKCDNLECDNLRSWTVYYYNEEKLIIRSCVNVTPCFEMGITPNHYDIYFWSKLHSVDHFGIIFWSQLLSHNF